METLTYVYLSCLLVGGVVVVLSALGIDADVDVDAPTAGGAVGVLAHLKIRRLFFFACFFGLTGLGVGLFLAKGTTLAVALGMGLVCAFAGDKLLQRLSDTSYSSDTQPEELIGLEATVTVPLAPEHPGKISCILKGHTMELVARLPAGAQPTPPGTRVLILEMRDGQALVEAEDLSSSPG